MDTEMDPEIWSRLPLPLLGLVVSKVCDIPSALRLRRVSKSMNAGILGLGVCPASLDNLLVCTYIDESNHLVLTFYNARTAAWNSRRISLYQLKGGDYPGHILLNQSAQLVASNGGLLCFGFPYNVKQIVMCNPTTKSWRKLPSMSTDKRLVPGMITWRVAGMHYESKSDTYKVIVAGFCCDERNEGQSLLKATQVYDSVSKSWVLSFQPAVSGGIWSTSVNKTVFSTDYLCLLTPSKWGSRYLVQIFSIKKKTWVEILADESVDDNGRAYLVDYGGEIFMVAEEKQDRLVSKTLGFWKLNLSNMEDLWKRCKWKRGYKNASEMWLKVKSVRIAEVAEFIELPIERMVWTCIGHKKLISFLFASETADGDVFNICLTHDMEADTWESLPLDSEAPNLQICAFEPSLSAGV